ncbi:uncharacterized protein [Littorina saxatilis]|uniref:uncharacterized protein n=1 Tax=Littorina saxatilis TaxID=31220 RepID=UPI0038B4BC66
MTDVMKDGIDDVISTSEVAKDQFYWNQNDQSHDHYNQSPELFRNLRRITGRRNTEHGDHTLHEKQIHPQRRVSFPSDSSAFDVISHAPRHDVTSAESPPSPHSTSLSESFPPARTYTTDKTFPLNPSSNGFSMGHHKFPIIPLWPMQAGNMSALSRSHSLAEPCAGSTPLQVNLNMSFNDHFEQLKNLLERSKRLNSAGQRSSSPEKSDQVFNDKSSAVDDSAKKADDVDYCQSPLSLKRKYSEESQMDLIEEHEEDHEGAEIDTDSLREHRRLTPSPDRITQNSPPGPASPSSPEITSRLTTSHTSYTSLMMSLASGTVMRDSFISHLSALQSLPTHPNLYHLSPTSYPAGLQMPHPGVLPVSGLQPVLPGGRAMHPRMGAAPGLGYYPSGLVLGEGMPVGRTSSLDKPPAVKKYKCDVCEKAFSRSNTLVTHKRIHTGDKPFKCERCGRAFRQPGNLTRHRLTHTTHKPYVCSQCGKAFNRASNLNTHMRTHSGIRVFPCTSCPKQFNHKNDLRLHLYSHGEQQSALSAVPMLHH